MNSFEAETPSRKAVLMVDADLTPTSSIVERLIEEGFYVCLSETVEGALLHLRERTISYAVTEIKLRDGNAFEVIEAVKRINPFCRTIVHSRFCNLSTVVQATKAGASDVIPKPVEVEFLLTALLDRSFTAAEYGDFLGHPDDLRAEYIRQTYKSCEASATRTARTLSMHRRTLERFIKRTYHV
jgi:two-component system response regulator RegA